jgi:hypothetical protein
MGVFNVSWVFAKGLFEPINNRRDAKYKTFSVPVPKRGGTDVWLVDDDEANRTQ